MNHPRNMLVEKVFENDGFVYHPVKVAIGDNSQTLYRKERKLVAVGVFVGINDHGMIRMGWSKCCLKDRMEKGKMVKGDAFDVNLGINEAIRNMQLASNTPVPTGRDFNKKFDAFRNRCIRYFQDAHLIEIDGKVMEVDEYIYALSHISHKKDVKSVPPAVPANPATPARGRQECIEGIVDVLNGKPTTAQEYNSLIEGIVDVLNGKPTTAQEYNSLINDALTEISKYLGIPVVTAIPNDQMAGKVDVADACDCKAGTCKGTCCAV